MHIQKTKQLQGPMQQKKDVRPNSHLHPILQMQHQLGNRSVIQMMMNPEEETEKKQPPPPITTSESSQEETTTQTSSEVESKTNEEDQDPGKTMMKLQGIVKTQNYRTLIKDAQKFCKQGGVGRDLVPPREIISLYNFLISKESEIKPLLIALSKVKEKVNKSTQNAMLELANKVMDGINLVIDGVNKAEANTRVWMLDGNESEIDGVQPARSLAFDLYDLWDAAATVNTSRKKGTLVAPASMRKSNAIRNFKNGSYSALR